ncbi:hypothetical protein FRC04_000948 [Tulasnella sp. 424]|nr:hypothetical protein FRC04_000948 [Tulasnella sp. 424]KAG8977862.1 hypothetical protein FRC05_000390 [Tulasnella sp. 425]
MNPQWQQQQWQRQQLQAFQQYPQSTGFGPQSSFDLPFASQPTGFQPDAFHPPLPPSFPQAQPIGFAGVAGPSALAAQPTGFDDSPMRMMPSTFMPASTSMPYGTGFNPQFAGPGQYAQGPSLQQSMQQYNQNAWGGLEFSWALSEDERQNYYNIFRRWDTQGTGFISGETAWELFERTGLSQEDLSEIWGLVVPMGCGSLNLPEFQVVMGLIERLKVNCHIVVGLNGAPIPTVLPRELVPFSEEDLEDSYDAQQTGFGDPPMGMTSPTFMPDNTSTQQAQIASSAQQAQIASPAQQAQISPAQQAQLTTLKYQLARQQMQLNLQLSTQFANSIGQIGKSVLEAAA